MSLVQFGKARVEVLFWDDQQMAVLYNPVIQSYAQTKNDTKEKKRGAHPDKTRTKKY